MTTHFTATADKIGYYVEQARDTAADLIAVLLQSTGVQGDTAMADNATLAAIFAAGNLEADFTGYTRKTLANPSRTQIAATDRIVMNVTSPITWLAAGGANNDSLARILYCYLPTVGAANNLILPLMCTDIAVTTDGRDLVVTVHADGFSFVRRP